MVYDRRCSSFATSCLHDFDFDKALAGAAWLHISGITPALSSGTLKATEAAIALAREKGCRVSFDLNYRSKLWGAKDAGRQTGAEIIEFATASGVLKHSINGDLALSTVAEIENLVRSGRPGRLSR